MKSVGLEILIEYQTQSFRLLQSGRWYIEEITQQR